MSAAGRLFPQIHNSKEKEHEKDDDQIDPDHTLPDHSYSNTIEFLWPRTASIMLSRRTGVSDKVISSFTDERG